MTKKKVSQMGKYERDMITQIMGLLPKKVRDFLVVREDESNFTVSPYYLHSGGTILDWIPLDSEMAVNECKLKG